MTVITAPSRPRIWPFFAWAAVGAGICVGPLAAFTPIGLLVLPFVIAGLTVLLIWPGSRTSAALGLISGLGLVSLVVAYWSPWPWLGAGLLLVAVGAVAFAWLRARVSAAPSGPRPPRPDPG